MKIYLAGKVSKNDWRHSIVPSLRLCQPTMHTVDRKPFFIEFPILENAISGQHDYVGPYFIGCDHGCLHGPEQHGLGASGDTGCNATLQEATAHVDDAGAWRRCIIAECKSAICRADVVFAYVDTPDCHGTLVEIGYALAMRKSVWVAFSSHELAAEMWFPFLSGHRHSVLCLSAGETPSSKLEEFCRLYGQEAEMRSERVEESFNRHPRILRALTCQVNETLLRAEDLANGGSAAWRELIYDAVVKPLSQALREAGGSYK